MSIILPKALPSNPLMEFRFRPGDARRAPSEVCSSAAITCFILSDSPMAGGSVKEAEETNECYVVLRDDVLKEEELERGEAQKERIREGLSKDMTNKRLIDEEMRREITGVLPTEMPGPSAVPVSVVRTDVDLPRLELIAAALEAVASGHHHCRPRPELIVAAAEVVACSHRHGMPIHSATIGNGGLLNTCTGGKKKKGRHSGGISKAPSVKNYWSCELCQVKSTSKESLDIHLNGKKHKTADARLAPVSKQSSVHQPLCTGIGGKKKKGISTGGISKAPSVKNYWGCELCQVKSTSKESLDIHLNGKKHKTADARLVPPVYNPQSELPVESISSMHTMIWSCSICQVSVYSEKNLNNHIAGRQHQKKKAMQTFLLRKAGNATGVKMITSMPNEAIKSLPDESSSNTLVKNGVEKISEPSGGVGFPDIATKNKTDSSVAGLPDKNQSGISGVQMSEMTPKIPGTEGADGFWCQVCMLKCNSHTTMDAHLKGKKHKSHLPVFLSQFGVSATRDIIMDSKSVFIQQYEECKGENVVSNTDEIMEGKIPIVNTTEVHK